MGIFSRKQDDNQDYGQDEFYDEPAQQDQPAPLPAPSVDGVLPPGMTPAPAPPSHNLASQSTPPTGQQASSATVDDTAGDYIEASPPAPQPSQDWSQPVDNSPSLADELALEPTYEETTSPAPATEKPLPSPAAEPVSEPEPEPVPNASYPPEQPAEDAQPSAQTETTTEETPEESVPVNVSSGSDDLGGIKQQALTQLSSLAGHLEQSPEEKFHTTMMLVQATDDSSLIKTAYEAAQAITDEKTRAQALLDVVNEINYFSQKNS